MAKKWLVALIELSEADLNLELTAVPAKLGSLLGSEPYAEMDSVFLLTPEQKTVIERVLELESLPFHDYAGESRGEKCRDPKCDKHRTCNVVGLHDKRPRY